MGSSVRLQMPNPERLLHGVPSHPTGHSLTDGQSTYGLGQSNSAISATCPVLLPHTSPLPGGHTRYPVRAVRLSTPQSHVDVLGKNTHVLETYGHALGHTHALCSKFHTRFVTDWAEMDVRENAV